MNVIESSLKRVICNKVFQFLMEIVNSMSHFEDDLRDSEVIAKFLDENLYPHIDFEIERIDDGDLQHAGVDVIATSPDGQELLIDEKAQTSYINDPRPTFILELSYMMDGSRRIGWFYDSSKETGSYLFVWIPEANTDSPTDPGEINRIYCLLIHRSTLLTYLGSEGFDRDRVLSRERSIRKSGEAGRIGTGRDDVYFFYSQHLDEEPVNLVMKYHLLHELCEASWEITHESVDSGVYLF